MIHGTAIVPFEDIKVGCWYQARVVKPEMELTAAIQAKIQDRKGPGALVSNLVPHRVLVIGINPAWKIVRYAEVSTMSGRGPVEWGKENGAHPVEARRYIAIGGAPKLFEGLRAQAFPNVIHGYIRLDAVCSSQYGTSENTELMYLPEARQLPPKAPDRPTQFSTVESPSWVLGYYKDMSRAWADNIYGGKGYDGVDDLKAEFGKIADIYAAEAEETALHLREMARASRERAAAAVRLERQQLNKWRLGRSSWGTSGLRPKWLATTSSAKTRTERRARRRAKRAKQKMEQKKTPPPESEEARNRRLMWERAAQAAPTKLPSKIIRMELKPDSVLVVDSKGQKPAGNSWILPAAAAAASGVQGGKKLQERGLFDDDDDNSDDNQFKDEDEDDEHSDRDDDGDDGDDSPFFYGPIRDEGHVQS